MQKVLGTCAVCGDAYLQIHPMQLEVDKWCFDCRAGIGDYLCLTEQYWPEDYFSHAETDS